MIFFRIFSSILVTQESNPSPRRASAISLGRVSMSSWTTSSTGAMSLSTHPSSLYMHISQEYFSRTTCSTSLAFGHPLFGFPFPFPFLRMRSRDLSLAFLPSPQTSMAALDLSPMVVSAMHIIISFSPSIQRPSFCLLGFSLFGLFLLGLVSHSSVSHAHHHHLLPVDTETVLLLAGLLLVRLVLAWLFSPHNRDSHCNNENGEEELHYS